MDTVKAVISIGEASIQLEGPQEFVEKYLELYRPDASKWQSALLQKGEVKPKGKAPKRIRAAKPKRGVTCAEKIRELISEGFFKELRTSADVKEHLLKKGVRFTTQEIAANLMNLFKSDELKRQLEGKKPKYYTNP